MSVITEWIQQLIEEEAKIQRITPKQKQVLMATLELMSEKSFDKVSTAEIAKKAGVAEGTVFVQYKTKKGLLRAVIKPAFLHLVAPALMKDVVKNVMNQEHTSFQSFVSTLIENRAHVAKREAQVLKFIIQELLMEEDVRKELEHLFNLHIYPSFHRLVTHFKETGDIDETLSTYTVFRIIVTNIVGYLFPRYILYPHFEWDDEMEKSRMIRLIVEGLKPVEKE